MKVMNDQTDAGLRGVSYEEYIGKLEEQVKDLEVDSFYPRFNGRCNPYHKEMVYIILSLSAKTTLGILLFTNVFMNQ